jgi:hypothetical protein
MENTLFFYFLFHFLNLLWPLNFAAQFILIDPLGEYCTQCSCLVVVRGAWANKINWTSATEISCSWRWQSKACPKTVLRCWNTLYIYKHKHMKSYFERGRIHSLQSGWWRFTGRYSTPTKSTYLAVKFEKTKYVSSNHLHGECLLICEWYWLLIPLYKFSISQLLFAHLPSHSVYIALFTI